MGLKLKPAKPKFKVVSTKKSKVVTGVKQKSELTAIPYQRCFLYGSALVAAEIEDSDFCVHGPQGCMSAVQEAFAVQGKEYDYHQSGLTQTDVIFGGERCLTKSLVEALHPYEKAGPKFMVSSCAPEIIGDNMDKIAALVNPKIPLVKVSGGGFKGNQYDGIEKTLLALVTRFATQKRTKKGLVNLIGTIGLSPTWRADTYAAGQLLQEFNLQVNYLGCNSTITNFVQAASAQATVLLSPLVGYAAANFLKEQFQQPFFCSSLYLPLGLRGIETWLKEILPELGVSPSAVAAFLAKKENWLRDKLKVGLGQTVFIKKIMAAKESRVAIAAEGEVAFAWYRFLAEELELPVRLVILRTKTAEVEENFRRWQTKLKTETQLLWQPDWFTCQAALKKEKINFMLGSSLECELAQANGAATFLITHPNTTTLFLAEHATLGYGGLINTVESLLNSLKEVA